MEGYPEPIRQLPVTGSWAYLDRLEASPGSSISVHVSAEAAHEIELVRLGLDAVIDPDQSLAADCAEAVRLAVVEAAAAAPQTITPGSYAWIAGEPVPAGTLCLGLWLRLWKLPVIDVVQVGWQALISDIDYPAAARFGLLVDHLGRLGVYLGDGGVFRHEWLHHSPPVMGARLGRWAHIAACWSPEELRIFLDGSLIHAERLTPPPAAVGGQSRLRLGAMPGRRRGSPPTAPGSLCRPSGSASCSPGGRSTRSRARSSRMPAGMAGMATSPTTPPGWSAGRASTPSAACRWNTGRATIPTMATACASAATT